MSNIINTYTVFESVSAIILIDEVSENFVKGNIVANHRCRFFTEKGEDIGFVIIHEDDQHKVVKGDYNGKRLLDKFQYLK